MTLKETIISSSIFRTLVFWSHYKLIEYFFFLLSEIPIFYKFFNYVRLLRIILIRLSSLTHCQCLSIFFCPTYTKLIFACGLFISKIMVNMWRYSCLNSRYIHIGSSTKHILNKILNIDPQHILNIFTLHEHLCKESIKC